LFGVHPMRVEPVAWASAFPYLAALIFAVLATLAYVASRTSPWIGGQSRRPTFGAVGWSVAAVASFAVSLGFRPIAVGLPLILLLLDWYPLRAAHRRAGRHRAIPLLVDKIPYALIAVLAVGLEWFARRQVGFNELSMGARLTLAATSPFVYLWRTAAPVELSPVPVLSLNAQGSVAGIVCATLSGAILAVGWGLRDRRPAVLALWVAYLLLVAPVAGLAPTGLQAIADRYAYLPAVAIAISAGAAIGSVAWNRRVVLAATGAALIGLSVLAWKQTLVWQDSVALWTRAAQLDPQNDVAFYNLGSALQDLGRSDEAMAAYEATLRLVPDHVPARRNLSGLQAIARQRDADALASSGNFAAAIPIYRETLTLDPRRARARAGLGVALARTGRFEEAAQELARAMEQGVDDPAVINAAGFSLVQTGRTDEAVRLLRAAQARHPDDPDIAHNLELLLNGR
jgi:Flp pilus assembly protein TadD